MSLKKRIIAGILSSAFFFTSLLGLCSCSNKKGKVSGKVETVTEDTPWYDTKEITIGTQYDKTEYDYLSFNGTTKSGDNYFTVSVTGSKVVDPDVASDPDFDYNDYSISYLDTYDYDGNLVSSFDLMSIPEISNSENGGSWVGSFPSSEEGKLNILYMIYGDEENNWSSDYKICKLDIATGTVGDSTDWELPDVGSESVEKIIQLPDGNMLASVYVSSDDNSSNYDLVIFNETGIVNIVDLSKAIPGSSIYDVQSYITMDDTHIFFDYVSNSGSDDFSSSYGVLDLTDYSVDTTQDFSWIGNIRMATTGDGSAYVQKETGIESLNFDTQQLETVFDYNSCNINRFSIEYLQVLSLSDDSIVLVGDVYEATSTSYKIFVLTKADSNPNVGKSILNVGSLSTLDIASAQAIVDFNSSSEDYFVNYTSYSIEDYMSESNTDDSTAVEAYTEASSKMADQLAVDLIAGEGPDVILNASMCNQLNNDQYLLDLTSYMTGDDGINTEEYFSNIFEGAKDGDALYQIPITFSLSGIITRNDNVPDGQVGFTYDQYESFVSGPCNGSDPMNVYFGRNDYFSTCFSVMFDSFVDDDGNINVAGNDDFSELAQFCLDNVAEESTITGEDYSDGFEGSTEAEASYTTLSTFPQYVNAVYNKPTEYGVYGIPSSDGRGPSFTVASSAAISANSAIPDAGWQFIKCLLSEKSQTLAGDVGNPVNISAFNAYSSAAVDEYNKQYDQLSAYMTEQELIAYGVYHYDVALIDTYQTILESAKSCIKQDTGIIMIVNEEIPAFFSGQKSIEDVADIIQDRAQTVIDERG